MSRVYHDPAAEREANDIGLKFAHSSDVVGDMSRAYGADLSSVRLHNDASAHRQTAQRGVDAFSTGKDIFFARGAYDRNDPASRGLLAHELTHSLQQQNAVTASAPAGAEQGGIIDFFRRLFHRRRRQPTIRTQHDMEKQRRTAELDAEDEKFAQWGRDAVQESRDANLAQEMGVAEGGVTGAVKDDSEAFVDLPSLLEQAHAKGWKRYHGGAGGRLEDFNSSIMENFFREASGSAVQEKVDPVTGKRTWSVSTGVQSMESMMDVFNGHDEASTLRFLQPMMDFSVEDFTRRYPIHQMSPQQRQSVYGPATAELQKLIGVKQWGEKFGVPLLSEANRKRFDERMMQFIQVTAWLSKIIMADGRTSIAQDLEMDLLADKRGRRAYEAADFAGAVGEVKDRLSGGGEIVPYSEFQSVMGDVLGSGSPEHQMNRLSWQITGLSYDEESKTVTTPVPLAELRKLAAGDEETLSAYADKLRGMSWRDENGKERRAAQYDADQDEFAAGFASDFSYFADMGNTAFLLKTFGKDFLDRQTDRQDLSTRAALGMNTRKMLLNRAQTPLQSQTNLFISQFGGRYDPEKLGGRDTAVARPTWIKRQLLESQRYEQKPQEKNNRTYYTTQGSALADMIANAAAMDPTLLQTSQMRAMALQSFQQGFGQMLAEYDDADFTSMTSVTFRGNGSGELNAYNAILKANSGALIADLTQAMDGGERDDAMVDHCLNIICDHVEDQGDALHDMVLGGVQATQRSAHFQGRPDLQSKYMMNNLVLRVIAPQIASVDTRFAGKLMSAVNTGTSPACDRLRNLLAGR